MNGSLALVLHAHLPYVRHPEHERFLEEDWLHEAVAECYLPLLRRMSAWEADGVDWHLTLGITPTLGAMLDDPLLRSRTGRYLGERITLAELECTRTVLEPARRRVAEFHREFYQGVHSLWEALGGWSSVARLTSAGSACARPASGCRNAPGPRPWNRCCTRRECVASCWKHRR